MFPWTVGGRMSNSFNHAFPLFVEAATGILFDNRLRLLQRFRRAQAAVSLKGAKNRAPHRLIRNAWCLKPTAPKSLIFGDPPSGDPKRAGIRTPPSIPTHVSGFGMKAIFPTARAAFLIPPDRKAGR